VKGEGLYEHHYRHDDHALIAAMVRELHHRAWIVSYDATPQVLDLYRGLRRQQYGLAYSAQDRYAGSEVIFYSPSLTVPKVENPSKVRAA
jgi:DNA adenine methylase